MRRTRGELCVGCAEEARGSFIAVKYAADGWVIAAEVDREESGARVGCESRRRRGVAGPNAASGRGSCGTRPPPTGPGRTGIRPTEEEEELGAGGVAAWFAASGGYLRMS
jgi:hypothetical protein